MGYRILDYVCRSKILWLMFQKFWLRRLSLHPCELSFGRVVSNPIDNNIVKQYSIFFKKHDLWLQIIHNLVPHPMQARNLQNKIVDGNWASQRNMRKGNRRCNIRMKVMFCWKISNPKAKRFLLNARKYLNFRMKFQSYSVPGLLNQNPRQ